MTKKEIYQIYGSEIAKIMRTTDITEDETWHKVLQKIVVAVEKATSKRGEGTGMTNGTMVWRAYCDEYKLRYKIEPAGNARMARICKDLSESVGKDEAIELVRFYVGTNEQYLITNCHPLAILQSQFQKYLTMMRGEVGSKTAGKMRTATDSANTYLRRKYAGQ